MSETLIQTPFFPQPLGDFSGSGRLFFVKYLHFPLASFAAVAGVAALTRLPMLSRSWALPSAPCPGVRVGRGIRPRALRALQKQEPRLEGGVFTVPSRHSDRRIHAPKSLRPKASAQVLSRFANGFVDAGRINTGFAGKLGG